jgi:transcriptional regulator with XRE-family HTH domain
MASALHTRAYRQFLGRLKAARQASGMTQIQVARALGRHQSFISKSENGERRVDASEFAALAKLFRLPIRFYFSDFPE